MDLQTILESVLLTNLEDLVQAEVIGKVVIGDETVKALGINPAGALAMELTSASIRQEVDLKEDSMIKEIFWKSISSTQKSSGNLFQNLMTNTVTSGFDKMNVMIT
jgi:hypothetical protein